MRNYGCVKTPVLNFSGRPMQCNKIRFCGYVIKDNVQGYGRACGCVHWILKREDSVLPVAKYYPSKRQCLTVSTQRLKIPKNYDVSPGSFLLCRKMADSGAAAAKRCDSGLMPSVNMETISALTELEDLERVYQQLCLQEVRIKQPFTARFWCVSVYTHLAKQWYCWPKTLLRGVIHFDTFFGLNNFLEFVLPFQ